MAILADFLETCRSQILPIERQHIQFQMPQRKLQLDSIMNKEIGWQNLPDIPLRFKLFILFQLFNLLQSSKTFIQRLAPDTSLTQGMTQSQILSRENNKTFNFSRDTVPNRTGSKLCANSTEKLPMRQKSTNSSSSSVLQVSQQSPRDQDIQNSTDVSVKSFRDTETDPETTSNTDTGDSKKFQVSNFRNDLQRKGEVMLCLPIDSTQFQQFCKKLNDKELFLCRDLLEKEIYGK